jgi:hypothetical protein
MGVETDNPALITALNISYVQPGGTATLTFTPGTDQTGIARITVRVSCCMNETKMTFYVVVLDNTGMMEEKPSDIRIYPNPTDDLLFVEIPDPSYTDLSVNDLTGRIVLKKVLTSEGLVSIETSGYESGAYILTLSNGKEKLRTVFIVK